MKYLPLIVVLYCLPQAKREQLMRSTLLSRRTYSQLFALAVIQKQVPYWVQQLAASECRSYFSSRAILVKAGALNGTGMQRLVSVLAYGWTPIKPVAKGRIDCWRV